MLQRMVFEGLSLRNFLPQKDKGTRGSGSRKEDTRTREEARLIFGWAPRLLRSGGVLVEVFFFENCRVTTLLCISA